MHWSVVAVSVLAPSFNDDSVSGWISFIPFDLVVRDDDLFSDFPAWAPERTIGAFVSNDGDIPTIIHLEAVGPICVGFATARRDGIVGLHELLKPLAHIGRLILPLSKVPRRRRGRLKNQSKNQSNYDPEHVCLFQLRIKLSTSR
jgi:hypothetical protein